MLTEPNYKFDKIFSKQEDAIFPFFESKIVIERMADKQNDKIDYSEDITFYKNVTKKYTKPFNKNYIVQIPYQLSYKGNIFNPIKVDPTMKCFTHEKNDHKLRFGDFVIECEQNGAIRTVYEPVVSCVLNEDIDESLYFSDEAEISRLDNSDSEEEFENESDREEDTNLEIDAFSSFLLSSPKKKSPVKSDMLFRSLQRNISPIKNLHKERTGIISNNLKPKALGSVYSTYDNSMTISAKGIMKMVDESLVSSDTEIYNQSTSYIKKERSAFNSKPVINAADLISALDEEFEKPINT
ncbi:hypothetical protein CANINC_001204 [Pichia inconspicua]|uniref:Uncharacterized protein n=1 Tax=Pichia inconspicua TaxID=52247 RepID=A0A4T0X5D6_9ASCO|nr:hypothetical protein CANINC_001204 [[Candida] inconspicua]